MDQNLPKNELRHIWPIKYIFCIFWERFCSLLLVKFPNM